MGFTWNDATGRQWSAHVGIALAEDLRTCGTDLLEPKQLAELYKDPFKLVTLMAKVHAVQIEEHGLTRGDFIELATATEQVALDSVAALEAALVDFFRRFKRNALGAVLTKSSESAAALDADQVAVLNGPKAKAAIAAENKKALRELDRVLDSALGNGSGSTPAP